MTLTRQMTFWVLTLVVGLLREIVQMFIEQYPRLLEQIHQALSSSDGKALAAAAHTLRSSAGQVGAQV